MPGFLELAAKQLLILAEKRALTDPTAFIQDRRLQLDNTQQQLSLIAQKQLSAQQQRFATLAASLDALSPLRVLGRGYAMAQCEDGSVLKNVAQVAVGENIHVRLGQGSLRCTVNEKEEA